MILISHPPPPPSTSPRTTVTTQYSKRRCDYLSLTCSLVLLTLTFYFFTFCYLFYIVKILDYGEITERESRVVGRKGKRVSPPQFQFPVSVAVDRLGNVYVADYGNARVQILDLDGHVTREPLNIGGKCRPCALAVSLRGDLVMTDSQILRVFSKAGK